MENISVSKQQKLKTNNILAINGGEKECNIKWPSWPIWGDGERKGLNDVLESGKWWYGDKVKEFEASYAAFHGAKYGVTCSSGTTAISVALRALGIGAGDEVIIPPYTFIATATAVLEANAIPVFADIDPANLCIDPDDVERKITSKTKAIMPVHLGGHVADMDLLGEIAHEHELFLIEDACHSWGSQWKGKGTGALGDCGVFSFQANKNITSAEGGIILTDNEEIADVCRSLTNCGRAKGEPWYRHFNLGSNLRLTEFQAALLLAQLSRLEEQTIKRQDNARILDKELKDIQGIMVIENDARMTRRSYHFYSFRIDESVLQISRDKFVAALEAEGVPVNKGYPFPLYKNPLFVNAENNIGSCPLHCSYSGKDIDYNQVSCPVCEQVCGDTCWITHQALLADSDAMLSIVSSIRKVCEHIDG
jgi:dTDP-4-amino-4,6-dideoxygalactose transaminase